MAAAQRLQKELRDACKSTEDDIKLTLLDGQNLFQWKCIIKGPPDTPFEGGHYEVHLKIPSDYPMVPPQAKFSTPIFHPNVKFEDGEICLDILKSKWTPAWTLGSVARAIASLMSEPEGSSPLNCDAGNLVREDQNLGFVSLARMYAIRNGGAKPLSW
eukprot:GILI01024888.1.p1 GENE.GILI01024888.1~~GILI01024888.1.p1  ORF type:complete len:158 (-),score=21.99 GILI01024888.1:43-516(-)